MTYCAELIRRDDDRAAAGLRSGPAAGVKSLGAGSFGGVRGLSPS